MNLSLNQSEAPAGWVDNEAAASLAGIASNLGPPDGVVGLVIVDDARIREINREFRGIDAATDVISFSYLDDGAPANPDDDLVGEIYLSRDTLEREAGQVGVSHRDLFLRLGVHGIFHVLGFDHEVESQAHDMQCREREVLASHVSPEALGLLF